MSPVTVEKGSTIGMRLQRVASGERSALTLAQPATIAVLMVVLVALTACNSTSETPVEAGLNYMAAAVDDDWDGMMEYLPDEYLNPEYDRRNVIRFVKFPTGVGMLVPPEDLLEEQNWTVETIKAQTRLRYLHQPGVVMWMKKENGRWLVDPGFDALVFIEWLAQRETVGFSSGIKRMTDRSNLPRTDAFRMLKARLHAIRRIGETEAYVRWHFWLRGSGEVPISNFNWTVADEPVQGELIRTNAVLDGEVLRIPAISVGDGQMRTILTLTFHLKGLPPGETDATFTVSELKVGEDALITRTVEFELRNVPPIE